MSRFIDIPIHLEAAVHIGARLADRGQHSVYEATCNLATSPGSYRWICSDVRPRADRMQSYNSHSNFVYQLSDECHKLDAEALLYLGLDDENLSCHDMEIYVIWDPNSSGGIMEIKQENWPAFVAQMTRRLHYWDRSGMEGVSFYVKWIYTPIEHRNITTDQDSSTSDVAVRSSGEIASSTETEIEPPSQETEIVVDASDATEVDDQLETTTHNIHLRPARRNSF